MEIPLRFEDEYPEEAKILMDICEERGKQLEDGKKLKPLYLDAPLPYKREIPRVGRNEPCPCGSGKKFKKCCIMEM